MNSHEENCKNDKSHFATDCRKKFWMKFRQKYLHLQKRTEAVWSNTFQRAVKHELTQNGFRNEIWIWMNIFRKLSMTTAILFEVLLFLTRLTNPSKELDKPFDAVACSLTQQSCNISYIHECYNFQVLLNLFQRCWCMLGHFRGCRLWRCLWF